MSFDVNKAFDVPEHGILFSDATGNLILVTGGTGLPTDPAPIGSRYFRTNGEQYVQRGPGSTDWALSYTSQYWPTETYLFFTDPSHPYAEVGKTSYELLGTFYFSGTTLAGIPTSIRAVVGTSDGYVTDADLKVVDFTNTTTIVTKANIATGSKTMVDLGTLANLSAAGAVWEIHGKRNISRSLLLYTLIISY